MATTEDPRVTRSRTIILDGALQEFLANGYVGTGVDAIAAAAGVSKRTVYNLYGTKEALFRAVLQEAIDTAEGFARDISERTLEVAEGSDLADDLTDLAVAQATAILASRVVRLRRLLVGEAERFPELAAEYYERAPGRVMGALAELFAACSERGRLAVDDPHLAAEHFAFLVVGAGLDRAMFDRPDRTPDLEHIAARARAGAAAFLRAYGV